MGTPPLELPLAHRWFAVEANNRAWDLVEAESRTPDEQAGMISAAHTAAFHWAAVGKPINALRAECLLSMAYLRAGVAERALHHARRCQEAATAKPEGISPFDEATALAGLAAAERASGNVARADELHAAALALVPTFQHADEADVFGKLYPSPAL